MTTYDFMGAHPWLTFFLAWLAVCAIGAICRAIAAFGRKS